MSPSFLVPQGQGWPQKLLINDEWVHVSFFIGTPRSGWPQKLLINDEWVGGYVP